MWQRFLLLGILWLLVGCSGGKTQALVATSFSENTAAPSQQPRPYVTPRPSWTPTITFLPTIIVPYRSGSLLRDGILTIDDLPRNTYSELEFFRDDLPGSNPNAPPATILDVTEDMIQADECPLDCVKQVWKKYDYQMVIRLSRVSSVDQADYSISNLRDYLLEQPDSEDQSRYPEFSGDGLPGNTWIIWAKGDLYYLGSSRGPLLLILAGNITGDDAPHYGRILIEFARLQFDKLARLGFIP